MMLAVSVMQLSAATAFNQIAALRAPARCNVARMAIECVLPSRTVSDPGFELMSPCARRRDLPGAGPETGGKVFDPLGLSKMCPYGSANYEWMRTAELKHGRVCMAASIGWVLVEAGIHFPGYLSKSADVTFASLPTSGLAAWDAVPMAGKMQYY